MKYYLDNILKIFSTLNSIRFCDFLIIFFNIDRRLREGELFSFLLYNSKHFQCAANLRKI